MADERQPNNAASRAAPAGRSAAAGAPAGVSEWLDRLLEAARPLRSSRREDDVLEMLVHLIGTAVGADAAFIAAPAGPEGLRILRTDDGAADLRPGSGASALVRAALLAERPILARPGESTAWAGAAAELDSAAALAVPLVWQAATPMALLLAFDSIPDGRTIRCVEGFVLPFAMALLRHDPATGNDKQFLAAIVEGSSDAIFAKDLDGIITSWNIGAERIYGYRPDEIIGRSVATLVPAGIDNDVPEILDRLRRGERVEQYETLRVTKHGRRVVVALTISPIHGPDGRLIGASTIARDITQRRRVEERQQLLAEIGRTLTDSLDDEQTLRDLARFLVRGLADCAVTYSLDADGAIRRVGAAHADPAQQAHVERLLGLTPPHVFDAYGAGAVLRTGEPALMQDITPELLLNATGGGDYLAALERIRPLSAIILPMRARGRILGAITCVTTHVSGRRYTQDDVDFAGEIADRAALALDNARLLAESRSELQRRERVEAALRVRYEQLRVLYQMTEAVGRAAGLDEIYDEALLAMQRYLGNELAAILLWDADDVMRFKAWQGLSDTYRNAVEGHSPWPRDTEDPQPILIPDVAASHDLDPWVRDSLRAEGIRAVAFVPLVFGRRLLGKFVLYFEEPRALASDELELTQAIAGSIAFAITRMLDEQNVRIARDLAERASQAKSQFLGVMSHELRTPLNAVIGYADLLLMEIRGPLTDGQRHQVERMRASARHQLDLIEELLTYTRIEAGREEARLMTTDVRRIISDVAEFVRPEAEMKGIDLRVELPDAALDIVTDPAKLRQIVLNLAGNATKFTHAGKVVLHAWREGDHVIAEVRDTGPGIPPNKLAWIFEPFAQVEGGRTRPSGGTGLGLAIARRFAEMLGGDIAVTSEVGKGSTFRVRLPARFVPARPQPDPDGDRSGAVRS